MIELDTLRTRLKLPREVGAASDAPPLLATPILHAAVSVVLRPASEGPELLLIKRSDHEQDPWSGHMAFPGGKHEPRDPHLLGTAIRETREETELVLPHADHPGFLGRLPGVSPRGAKRLPPLVVTPFLFEVEEGRQARIGSGEVQQIHWVPLSELMSPANRGEYVMPIGGARRTFPSIDVAGEQVWGLTWRVIDGLRAALDGGTP